MVQMQAQCPFEVVTTYDFKESLSSKGSGDDMPLTMWSPKLQGQNEYFVGDVCQNNWKANLECLSRNQSFLKPEAFIPRALHRNPDCSPENHKP